jgi:hypothetical protein
MIKRTVPDRNRFAHDRSQNVIAASDKFAHRAFACSNYCPAHACACIQRTFETGATQKFAQIFFRRDNDLRGKRGRDPKNAYVTGIFDERYIVKYFPARCVLPDNFCVEIARDSNTLDKTTAWPYRHSCANCDCRYRRICKFRCGPTSLVYLENTHGNSSRALRNKVPSHAHRRMRTALVCRSVELKQFKNGDRVRVRNQSKLTKFGARTLKLDARRREARTLARNKTTGESRQSIRGVMS